MNESKEALSEQNRELVQNKTSDFGSENCGLSPQPPYDTCTLQLHLSICIGPNRTSLQPNPPPFRPPMFGRDNTVLIYCPSLMSPPT